MSNRLEIQKVAQTLLACQGFHPHWILRRFAVMQYTPLFYQLDSLSISSPHIRIFTNPPGRIAGSIFLQSTIPPKTRSTPALDGNTLATRIDESLRKRRCLRCKVRVFLRHMLCTCLTGESPIPRSYIAICSGFT